MKKMSEKAMKNANGGWGTWCPVCRKGKTFAWWNKAGARAWVLSHIHHGAYIC